MDSLACQSLSMQALEEYVLSENKQKISSDWIESGIASKEYLRLLLSLSTVGIAGLSKDEKEKLKEWTDSRRFKEFLNPVLKYYLSIIESEQDLEIKTKLIQEFNTKFLHFNFNDERDMRRVKVQTPQVPDEKSKNKKKADEVTGSQNRSELSDADLKELSTAELIKNITEDKTFYNFELETANLSFLKKIDLAKVVRPARIETILRRLPDFGFNKVYTL